MKISYVANDGTEFDNERECLAYEEMHNYSELVLMDGNFKKTTDVENAYACIVRSGKESEIIKNFCDDWGVYSDGIQGPGIYVWSDEKELWYRIEDEYREIEKRKEFLDNTKKFFEPYEQK